MNHKLSMPIIASILVLGIFAIGLSFDDAEAKTTISESKFVHSNVNVGTVSDSAQRGSFIIGSILDDDTQIQFAYAYYDSVTGEESRGSGTFEKSLIYTGDLKKKFTVNINTADLDFESKSGDDGIISTNVKIDGKFYFSENSEEEERCDTDVNTGIETCTKEKESFKQKSGIASGTFFGVDTHRAYFSENVFSEKMWTNP